MSKNLVFLLLDKYDKGTLIDIALRDEFINSRTKIHENEYPNIYLDHRVSSDEFQDAINTIITYYMQNQVKSTIVDLDERNKKLEPIKEMTLKEIEKELGYKFKIINEEDKHNETNKNRANKNGK